VCGRYSLNLKDNHHCFKTENVKKFSSIFQYNNDDISPSSNAPIIIRKNNKYVFLLAKWGLIFDWLPQGKTLFNLRSETVKEKKFSKNLLESQKCLIPFNHYYEWKKEGENKLKYKIFFEDNPVSYFLGVYQIINNQYYFSILTLPSPANLAGDVHARCPQMTSNGIHARDWFSGKGPWLENNYINPKDGIAAILGLNYERI
tara:strand:+ start:899 stop:1504 length:606 start_codon:yes stop_codon:yes gene_type:complete